MTRTFEIKWNEFVEAVQIMSRQGEIKTLPSPINLGVRSPFQKTLVVSARQRIDEPEEDSNAICPSKEKTPDYADKADS
jgi:hypothetical protein